VARRLVDEQLAGSTTRLFSRGRGLVFSDVRAYYPGDDVRAIDWNITARNERAARQAVRRGARTARSNLMIDMSASGFFGTRGAIKRELAAELAAVVAFSAIKNNDRVGLYIVTDRVEQFVPPKKGRRHVLRVIGEILAFQPTSRHTNLAAGLDLPGQGRAASIGGVSGCQTFCPKAGNARCRSPGRGTSSFRSSSATRWSRALPPVGLLVLEDLESGELVEIDTSSAAAADYARRARAAAQAREMALRRLNVDRSRG